MQRYALRNTDLLLHGMTAPEHSGLKHYVLKIHDLADDDRPREKMIEHGPGALTTVELVAIILHTGTKKEDVLSMATRLVKEYGERTLRGYTKPVQMAEALDIPLTKALQVAACAELGRRFFQPGSIGAATLRTSQDVYDYVTDMRLLTKEHFRGLYLNTHYQVIHNEVLSIGTVGSNLVHPREVFKPAIEYNAVGIILVHNHPSGVVVPSQADIDVTRQLVEVGTIMGIHIIDHVIVSKDEFRSIEVSYE